MSYCLRCFIYLWAIVFGASYIHYQYFMPISMETQLKLYFTVGQDSFCGVNSTVLGMSIESSDVKIIDIPEISQLSDTRYNTSSLTCMKACEASRECYTWNFDNASSLCTNTITQQHMDYSYGKTGFNVLWSQSVSQYETSRTGQKICATGKLLFFFCVKVCCVFQNTGRIDQYGIVIVLLPSNRCIFSQKCIFYSCVPWFLNVMVRYCWLRYVWSPTNMSIPVFNVTPRLMAVQWFLLLLN